MLTEKQKERGLAAFARTGRIKDARQTLPGNRPEWRREMAALCRARRGDAAPAPEPKVPEKPPWVAPTPAVDKREQWPLPAPGSIKRYLFTTQVNNLRLVDGVWENLKALTKHYDARLVVSRVLYDFRVNMKMHKAAAETYQWKTWFDPRTEDYLVDHSVQVAPGLRFSGEMNILPSVARPLSSLEGYSQGGSGIYPTTKFAMESLPRFSGETPRFSYGTGAVTPAEYINRRTGQIARFKHCLGALLVEVNDKGEWWARQVQADHHGNIQDLDVSVSCGVVRTGYSVRAVVFGDLHLDQLSAAVDTAAWGSGGIVSRLKPETQVFHDSLDMQRRNHHTMKAPLEMYNRWAEDREDVSEEVRELGEFLADREAESKVVLVDSNHDRHLTRWLDEADYRKDPINAIFFLHAQLARHEWARMSEEPFELLSWALEHVGLRGDAKLLGPNESLQLCGVEHGLHGDRGNSGARGSLAGFAKMDAKVTVGHTHSAAIYDGVYMTGTSSVLRQRYNDGPTSWSHSHVVLYYNGQRAVITQRGDKPWAAS